MTTAFVTPDPLHVAFLSILPRIERHAHIVFRFIKCQDTKADKVQETVALAWRWFIRLAERGKDATRFASVLATYAAPGVKNGRKITGQEHANDAMNEQAHRRHDFLVESLPSSTATS